MSHSIDTNIHTHTSTHPDKYTYAHPTSVSSSERLGRLDFEIHEVNQKAHHCQRERCKDRLTKRGGVNWVFFKI
jgi:hypothetical protein